MSVCHHDLLASELGNVVRLLPSLDAQSMDMNVLDWPQRQSSTVP